MIGVWVCITKFSTGWCKLVVTKSNNKRSGKTRQKSTSAKKGTLTITTGCFAGLEITLKKKKTTLGRSVECDICLDDSLVSEEHAEIIRTEEGFVLNDLNSRNGTSINGKEVHNYKLNNGDIIEIGNFRLRFNL